MERNKSLDDLLSALTEGLSDEELLLASIQSDIAAAISTARTAKGLRQQELSNALGVTQGLVSRWENGDVNFTLQTLARIALKLEIEMKSPFAVTQSPVYLTNKPRTLPYETGPTYAAASSKSQKRGWTVRSGSQLTKV
nr:helix-turn-helix transcriptional regulator [uncultured Oscillibacter sp.]